MHPLTVSEAAEVARVSAHTIRNWYRENKIKGRRLGRNILIFRDEFLEFLEFYGKNALTPKVEGRKRYLPLAQVAKLLSCTLPILRAYLSENPKAGKRFGHALYFAESALEALQTYLNQQEAPK